MIWASMINRECWIIYHWRTCLVVAPSLLSPISVSCFFHLVRRWISLFIQAVRWAFGKAKSINYSMTFVIFVQPFWRWFHVSWTNSTIKFDQKCERKAFPVEFSSNWRLWVNWRWFGEAISHKRLSGINSFSTKSDNRSAVVWTVSSRPVRLSPVKSAGFLAPPFPVSSSNVTDKRNASSAVRKPFTISSLAKRAFRHRWTTSSWSMWPRKSITREMELAKCASRVRRSFRAISKTRRRRAKRSIRTDGCTQVTSADGRRTERWRSSIERRICTRSVHFHSPETGEKINQLFSSILVESRRIRRTGEDRRCVRPQSISLSSVRLRRFIGEFPHRSRSSRRRLREEVGRERRNLAWFEQRQIKADGSWWYDSGRKETWFDVLRTSQSHRIHQGIVYGGERTFDTDDESSSLRGGKEVQRTLSKDLSADQRVKWCSFFSKLFSKQREENTAFHLLKSSFVISRFDAFAIVSLACSFD